MPKEEVYFLLRLQILLADMVIIQMQFATFAAATAAAARRHHHHYPVGDFHHLEERKS